ncbi:MAG: type II toxin-antitoxin system RelE/ParE family toxin [Oscillospiraceae bacterium]|nr:type II toxin-antitoxin system RelE/ParE family toxin [Oscillospiraceae bacterium]
MSEHTSYSIEISDAALAMLDSHVNFLAQVSTDAAFKLMDKILGDIASLSEFPERYPVYDNKFISDSRYRKMLSAGRYLIFYEISASVVSVDYIVDCRQDYEWLIQ